MNEIRDEIERILELNDRFQNSASIEVLTASIFNALSPVLTKMTVHSYNQGIQAERDRILTLIEEM